MISGKTVFPVATKTIRPTIRKIGYSYRMRPLDIESPESKIRFYYDLLTLLQTDDIEHLALSIELVFALLDFLTN